jgi:hypothetical protein
VAAVERVLFRYVFGGIGVATFVAVTAYGMAVFWSVVADHGVAAAVTLQSVQLVAIPVATAVALRRWRPALRWAVAFSAPMAYLGTLALSLSGLDRLAVVGLALGVLGRRS